MNKVVYALLDNSKPGKYIYNDIEFTCEPFYIGMGGVKRPNQSKSRLGTNNGFDTLVFIIKSNLSQLEALETESKFIKCIKRICDGGSLINVATYGTTSEEISEYNSKRMTKLLKDKLENGTHVTQDKEFLKESSTRLTNILKEQLKSGTHITQNKDFLEKNSIRMTREFNQQLINGTHSSQNKDYNRATSNMLKTQVSSGVHIGQRNYKLRLDWLESIENNHQLTYEDCLVLNYPSGHRYGLSESINISGISIRNPSRGSYYVEVTNKQNLLDRKLFI